MKRLLILPLILLAFAFAGCTSGSSTQKDYEAGKEDARRALLDHDKVMEKENGLLEIRSRETALRSRGLDKRADAYVSGAQEIIDSVLSVHPE